MTGEPNRVAHFLEVLENKPSRVLIPLFILSLALRIYHLNFKSICDDEFMVTALSLRPFQDLLHFTLTKDFHPPFYYVLLYCLHHLYFNWSESFIVFNRFLSALAGSLLIFPACSICREHLNTKTALITCLFLSTSPILIEISQESRDYAIFCWLSTTTFYLMVSPAGLNSWPRKGLYLFITTLCLYISYWMLFVILAQFIYYTGTVWKKNKINIFRFQGFIAYLFFLPWLVSWVVIKFNNPEFHGKMHSLLSIPFYLRRMIHIQSELLIGFAPHRTLVFEILLLAYGIILLAGIYFILKKSLLLGISILVLILLPQLTGFFGGIVLYSKYIAFIVPYLIILVAYGISRLHYKWVIPIFLLYLVINTKELVFYYQIDVNPFVKQNFKSLAVYLKNHLQPGDRVISYGNHWIPNFYMDYSISHMHFIDLASSNSDNQLALDIIHEIDNPLYPRVWLTYLTFQKEELDNRILNHVLKDVYECHQFGDGIQMLLLVKNTGTTKSRQIRILNPKYDYAKLDNNPLLKITVSGDNYPNGTQTIPFQVHKLKYDAKGNLLPVYWSAPTPAFVEINLGREKTVDSVMVTPNNESYGAGEYSLSVWDNTKNQYVPTIPPSVYHDNPGHPGEFDFQPVTTDKIKIQFTRGGSGNQSIYITDIKIIGLEDSLNIK